MAERPHALTGAAGFARAWSAAVAETEYLPIEHAELELTLLRLTRRLAADLAREPFNPARGEEIGSELAATYVTSAEGLGRTIEVVGARLLRDLSIPGENARERLARLLGAVATGHARALRELTLDQQERILRAALVARQEAEAALRESEARFRYQATHDPLTDLANRTLFTDRLAAVFAPGAQRTARRAGVCFIDLDGFKAINDTLGHHIGDLLLMMVAERLRHRLASHLVARLGGDEFVVLVEDSTGTEEVIKVADAALSAITEPAIVEGNELKLSASIGVVECETAGSTPSELMRAADVTLHLAKSEGKGRWAVFDPVHNERELARYALATALPAALDRDEFFVEYQPLVSLDNGALAGAEALVRWRHPELGVLGPDHFIGAAEETGLIVRLGAQVLAEACQQARTWQRVRPDPPYISVNVAVRQLRDPGLVDTVLTLLNQASLPPGRLQLEVTESAVIAADDEPLRTLRMLADLGIRIAIDDFGTGYSNLAYLRRLPVCELKVAASFVEGLRHTGGAVDETTDERILATLVSLAHTLGLTVTAEGVETVEQARRLRTIGCDTGQGWYFGRPSTARQIAALPANLLPD